MKLEPMHDWVLLELDEVGDKEGDLHLPTHSSLTKQQMKRVTLLAVGPGKQEAAFGLDREGCPERLSIEDLDPGDRVLLKPNPGALCPEGLPRDDQRRFVKYDSIVARISEEGNGGASKVVEA